MARVSSFANRVPSASIAPIPSFDWKSFANRLPNSNYRNQLNSLRKNPDCQSFSQDLLRLGLDLRGEGDGELAAEVFSYLSGHEAITAEVRSEAGKQLDAILGKGGAGNRAEFLLGRLSRDATSSRAIIPMLAATMVGGVSKAFTMGRLLGRPAGLMTRGFGAQALSGAAGFGLEGLTFASLGRTLSPELPRSFGSDLASAYLSLGILKLAGAGTEKMFKTGAPTAIRLSAQFGGLFAAQRLEASLGLRPHVAGDIAFTDALASMLSLTVGSHLGRSLLGPGFSRFAGEVELRGRDAGNPGKPFENLTALGLAPATSSSRLAKTASEPFSSHNPAGPGLRLLLSVGSGEPPGSRNIPESKLSESQSKTPKVAHRTHEQEKSFERRAEAFLRQLRKRPGYVSSHSNSVDFRHAENLIQGFLDGMDGKQAPSELAEAVLDAFVHRRYDVRKTFREIFSEVWTNLNFEMNRNEPRFFGRPTAKISNPHRVAEIITAMRARGGEWSRIAETAESFNNSIKADFEWTGDEKRVFDSLNLQWLLETFGPENSTPAIAGLAMQQVKDHKAFILSPRELSYNLIDLKQHGELRGPIKQAPAFEVAPLPALREKPGGHAAALKAFEAFASRQPAWKETAARVRGLHQSLAEAESIQDRLVDAMVRVQELADENPAMTPPKAVRYLKAFELAARGEIAWESFEELDPVNLKGELGVFQKESKPRGGASGAGLALIGVGTSLATLLGTGNAHAAVAEINSLVDFSGTSFVPAAVSLGLGILAMAIRKSGKLDRPKKDPTPRQQVERILNHRYLHEAWEILKKWPEFEPHLSAEDHAALARQAETKLNHRGEVPQMLAIHFLARVMPHLSAEVREPLLEKIASKIDHPNPRVYSALIESLPAIARYLDRSMIETLQQKLSILRESDSLPFPTSDREGIDLALESLGNVPEDSGKNARDLDPQVVAALESHDPLLRQEAIQKLAATANKRAIPKVKRMLKDSDENVRLTAEQALAYLRWAVIGPTLHPFARMELAIQAFFSDYISIEPVGRKKPKGD